MTRVRLVLIAVFALVVGVGALHQQAAFDAQRQSEPPHAEPPVSAGTPGTPLPDVEGTQWMVAEVDAIAAHVWIENERLGIEAAVAIEAERVRDLRRSISGTPTSVSGDCERLAAEWGLPVAVIIRESGCRLDAYNATGCGGRGCIGLAQLDAGHFAAVSPWNPNVPGTCWGLDPNTIDGQRECAARLPASAW